MPRMTDRLVALFVALAVLGPFVSPEAIAQEGTPVPSPKSGKSTPPPVVGAPIHDLGAACLPAEFPAGENGITYQPLEDFGFVVPADAPGHNLYLTVSTLPAGSCILFNSGTFGASTFYVLEGTMQFISWSRTNTNIPVVKAGNEAGVEITVPDEAPVTLDAGDWVTVDREALYAYRNPSGEDARVIMAVYEVGAERANGCAGGCRRHP